MMLLKGFDAESKMVVCHKCDVPRCFNPDHLFVGTHADNVHDKIAKGRCGYVRRGEEIEIAKLNPHKVRRIRLMRELGSTWESIAQRMGVGVHAVRGCVVGETWRHVK